MTNLKNLYLHQESERIKYQPVSWELLPQWVSFFQSIPRVDFLGMDPSLDAEVHARVAIQRQMDRYEENGWGHVAGILKETEEFIGMCGLVPRELKSFKEMEAGYALIPKFWGNGYATEMAITMKNFCFEHLNYPRCISMIHPENEASKKVARKNGMTYLYGADYQGGLVEVFGVER